MAAGRAVAKVTTSYSKGNFQSFILITATASWEENIYFWGEECCSYACVYTLFCLLFSWEMILQK